MYLYVYLSFFLPTYGSVDRSNYLVIYLHLFLFIDPSGFVSQVIFLPTFISVFLSLPIYLSFVSIYIFIYIFIYLSTYLSMSTYRAN